MVKNWKETEMTFLKKNYSQMKNKKLAEILKRSESSVDYMAYVLQLKKRYLFSSLTQIG